MNDLFDRRQVKIKGETFNVHELSVNQRNEAHSAGENSDGSSVLAANYILMGCVEFNGKTIEEILELPGKVFDALSLAVAEISGMTQEEDAEKKP